MQRNFVPCTPYIYKRESGIFLSPPCYLPIIIPCTPGAHSWKLESIYGIASRCYREYSICITTDTTWIEKHKKQCKLLWHPKLFQDKKMLYDSWWMNNHICKACVYIRKWEEPEHPYSQSGRNKFSVCIEHCSRRILPVNSYHSTGMNKNKWILILMHFMVFL